MWGSNADRGVYKTSDGGRSWKKVLYVDTLTGAADIVLDPSNPQTMYATTFQRQRKGYGGNHVGPGSGIHKSVDGGETWTKLTRGLPKVDMGRIGLTISPVDPKMVYADVEVGGAVYTAPAGADGDCPPSDRSANAVRGQFDAGRAASIAPPTAAKRGSMCSTARISPSDRSCRSALIRRTRTVCIGSA